MEVEVFERNDGTRELRNKFVWEESSSVYCFEGAHLPAAILAISTIAVVGIGLVTFLWWSSCRRSKALLTEIKIKQRESCLKPSTGGVDSSYWKMTSKHHDKLRGERQWAPIFEFGQPWLRPLSVTLVFLTAFISYLARHAIMVRSCALCLVMLLACVLLSWPRLSVDHRWARWKKYPRGATLLVGALIPILQLLLLLQNETRAVSTNGEPSSAVVIMAWVIYVAICALPILQFTCLFTWFYSLFGCCALCSRKRSIGRGSTELVEFLAAEPSEHAVRGVGCNLWCCDSERSCG